MFDARYSSQSLSLFESLRVVIFGGFITVAMGLPTASAGWKAGAGKVSITPKQSMWMAGYGARTKPSEGAVHDLWAKALALESPDGKRALLVTLDICGIGRKLSVSLRDKLQAKHGLDRSRVVISCSHTHCGPVIGDNLISMYNIGEEDRRKIREYAMVLEGLIHEAADLAFARLADADLAWENGRCDFAVNRRANKEADVPELRKKLALQGPTDHDVPVLRIRRPDQSLLGVVFGYACHCTVMSFQKFCGDYAGYAQIAIEKQHPGAQAMFVAGCGGDQNPLPRRTLELAEQYGNQLALSVETVLSMSMRPISGPLRAAYEEIDLAFDKLPSKEQIEKDSLAKDFYIASRARLLLKTIADQGSLSQTQPYPIQIWGLDELDWVILGGEVVVDYSLRIKRNLGTSHTWVSAYCNDVLSYIPSLRVLKEGGYEGATSMIYYGHPTTWSDRVEEEIIAAVGRLNQVVHVAKPVPAPR